MHFSLRRTIPFILVAFLAVAAPAWGHSQTAIDRADAAGPVDTAAARIADRRSPETRRRYLDLQLVAYDAWTDDRLAGGRNFISFELDTNGDRNGDRCLVVQQREVEPGVFALEATVTRGCTYLADERVTSTLLVTRPDDHSVKIRIPWKAATGRSGEFRWRAVTSYEHTGDTACPAAEHGDGGYGSCADFTRWIRHS